ncbi:hypothetical protein HBI29_059650 [Parastagonospora nodorum]|nr:hypothetical protein HBH42_137400 [Parastagonospora nodorum]KAH4850031.1 hypothetical protein HBH75_137700 [Parastagonospora nodorum]KAH5188259.1 hypothetical protein HBH76_103220 [Parastagonospora nodorum]KAH5254395.1 hypothetical protein HBI72_134410 [Parastagonospora nodorum]KAH5265999.1 hypothetical protein HBI71_084070 [Parastagonospora nodorum]
MASPVDSVTGPAASAHPPSDSSSLLHAETNPAACDSDNEALLEYVQRSIDEDEDFAFMRFEALQRTNIVALQTKLVRLKDTLRKVKAISNEDLESLRLILEQYSTAIQNYHFLHRRKGLTKQESTQRRFVLQRYFQPQVNDISVFNSHYSYFDDAEPRTDALRSTLMNALPAWLTYSSNERSARRREFSEGKPPKEVSPFIDRLCRFTIAAVGGSFLVGPMLIMAIDSSTTKSLVTVSVSVLIFIAVLTFGVRVGNVEALVSTATYAAVLVVFVGSSTGGGGGTGQ